MSTRGGPQKPPRPMPRPRAAPTINDDDAAVDRFAAAMKLKLARKRNEGRRGWGDPVVCPPGRLARLLHDHLPKGDPLDIGNFAMMLWNRGESCALTTINEGGPDGSQEQRESALSDAPAPPSPDAIQMALRPLVIYESTNGTTTRKVLADDALRLQSLLRETDAALRRERERADVAEKYLAMERERNRMLQMGNAEPCCQEWATCNKRCAPLVEHLRAERDALLAALTELVALKDIKDESDYNLLYAQTTGSLERGKELATEYRSRKQQAWRDARAALAAIDAARKK